MLLLYFLQRCVVNRILRIYLPSKFCSFSKQCSARSSFYKILGYIQQMSAEIGLKISWKVPPNNVKRWSWKTLFSNECTLVRFFEFQIWLRQGSKSIILFFFIFSYFMHGQNDLHLRFSFGWMHGHNVWPFWARHRIEVHKRLQATHLRFR